MGRRPFIPQRRRVFVGCEGESERSYCALVSRLLDNRCLARGRRPDVHLDAVLLGGGDPLACVQIAQRRIKENQRKRGMPYVLHAVLIDRDRYGMAPERDQQIGPLSDKLNIHVIWQRPCHEALLLRHLEGCQQLQPATSQLALAALFDRWPDYAKGISAVRLAEMIDSAALARALAVEVELAEFLAKVGYP